MFPSLLCVALVAVLCVPNAKADGGTFTIQPRHEVKEEWNANAGWSYISMSGTISANGSIDFFVIDPSGAKLLSYNDTNSTNFSFAPQKNGTYMLYIVNPSAMENVTAVLTYGVDLKTVSHMGSNVGTTSQSSVSTVATLTYRPPDDHEPPEDNSQRDYVDFQRTTEIMRNLDEELQMILPIRLPAVAIYSILVTYAVGIAMMRLHETIGKDLRIAKRKKGKPIAHGSEVTAIPKYAA